MMRSSPSSSSSLSSSPLGVTAQKRRIRERDLWDVIVNNDDITFNHILPRLNSNDVKFLYEVNSETRKLIKRSPRAGDLKKRFDVSEMSSISTLEVAWENKSLWPRGWDETSFCWRVAETNKLELLKWAREEKKCKWDKRTINAAAYQGNLEMVKYCVANECPIDTGACAYAARNGPCALAAVNGHLEVLKYLREEAKAPWDWRSAAWAAEYGHLHILEYLVERKYDKYNEGACERAAANGHLECLKYLHEEAKVPWASGTASWAALKGHLHILEYLVERKYDKYNVIACRNAAENGHLDCLKYLHETAKAPWDEWSVYHAHKNDHPDCVQYLLVNDCPLPFGWLYEDGEYMLYSESESESESEE